MENNNRFNISQKDLVELRQYLDMLHGNRLRNVVNYGDDEEKFQNDIKELLQYIHELMKDEFHAIFLKRVQAGVYYGEYKKGIQLKKGVINLNNEDGLKRIFDSIQDEFQENFVLGAEHNCIEGWTPLSCIGDNVVLKVESIEEYDKNWFYQYTHNDKGKNK